MKCHQEVRVNLDVYVAISAYTKEVAFEILDRLSKKEILMLALNLSFCPKELLLKMVR